ncbi:hypothetical protein V7S43_012585 [Phytophthora oleae]|uniref:Uncharacterized protein n=1 Tax=Phytophthora oleae TaxID=2107226 RepID=A0ABD3F6Z5_9STRA
MTMKDGTTLKCLEFLNLMARWLQHSLPPYARETPQVVKDFVRAASNIKLLPKPEPAPPSIIWDSIPLSMMTPCQIRPQGLYCELKAKVCTAPMVIMVLATEENPIEVVLTTSSKLLLSKTETHTDLHRKVTQTNVLCGELKRKGCWTFCMNPKTPSILLVPGSNISRQTKALYASVRTVDVVEPQHEEDKSDSSKTPAEPLLTLFTSVPDQSSLRFDYKTNVCLRMERLSSRIFPVERNARCGEAFSITLTASLLQTATSGGGSGAAAAFSSVFEVKSTFVVSENNSEDPQDNDGRNLEAHTFVFILKSAVSSKKSGLKPDDAVLPRQWFTPLSAANETKLIIFEAQKESEIDKKEAKAARSSEIYQFFVFTLHGVYIEVACNAEIPEQIQENCDTEAQSASSEEDDGPSVVLESEVTSASLLKELLLLQKMRQREKTAEPLPDMVLGTQVSSTKPITTAESLRNKINLSRKDERHARLQELEAAIQAKLESKPRKTTPTSQELDSVEALPSPTTELEKRVHLLTTFFHEMAVHQPKLDELQGNAVEAAETKAEEQLLKGFSNLFHSDVDLQNALDEEKWSTDTAKIIRRRESITTNLPRIKPVEDACDQLEGKCPWTFEDYENTAQYIEQLMVDVETHETHQKEQQNIIDEERKREVTEQLVASWQYTQHRVDKAATRKRIQDLEHKRRSQWMQSQQIRVYSAKSERPAFILPKQRFLVQECSLPSNAVWEVSNTPNQSVLVTGSIATGRPTSPCQSPSKLCPRPPQRPATVSTERRNCIAVNSAAISRARVRRIRSAYSTIRVDATPRRQAHDVAVVLPFQEEPAVPLPLTDEVIAPTVEIIDDFETTTATFAVSNLQATLDSPVTGLEDEATKVKGTEKRKRKRKKRRSTVPKDVNFRSRVLELVSIAAQLQAIVAEERKEAKGIENVEEFGCMPSLTTTFTSKST